MDKKAEAGKKALLQAVENLIDDLPIDWGKIDPDKHYPAPEEEVGENEEVVGELSADQKILWSALLVATDQIYELEDGTPAVGYQNTVIALLRELLCCSVAVTAKIPELSATSAKIRADYKIVVDDPKKLPTFARAFFG